MSGGIGTAASVLALVTDAPDGAAQRGRRRPAVVRRGAFSFRWRRRTAVTAGILLIGAVLLALLSLVQGSFAISLDRIMAALSGGGTGVDRFTIFELRMPRTLTGVVVGIALGVSGALTQSVTRNPIASPDVLGVTAGASLGAVVVITVGGSTTALGVPGAALLGGLVTAALIFALSWRQGVDSLRLILTGIAVNAVLIALVSWMLVVAQLSRAVTANVWLVGSLDGATWASVVPALIGVSLLGAVAVGTSRLLRVLVLGDDTAAGLGVRTGVARTVLLLLAVALAAVGVAAAGPIGFIAFAAPQLAMRIAGTPTPPLLCSGLLGAVLITSSDLVIRFFSPVPLPVGIMTTAIGGPVLIYLIVRMNMRRSA